MEENRPTGIGIRKSRRLNGRTASNEATMIGNSDQESTVSTNSIQASIEKLNFSNAQAEQPGAATTTQSPDSHLKKLMNVAKSKGFDNCIIEKAFKTLKKPQRLNEQEFIEYLQIFRSKYDLYETEPVEVKKTNNVKSSSSSITQSSTTATASSSLLSISPPKVLPIEYVELYDTHVFDKDKEKNNKIIRMTKLVSLMPDQQKPMAMSHMAKLVSSNSTNLMSNKKSSVSSNDKGSQESIEELSSSVKLPFLAYSDESGNKSKKARSTEQPIMSNDQLLAQICPEDIDLAHRRPPDLAGMIIQENLNWKNQPKGKGVKFSNQNQRRRGDTMNNKKMKRRSKSMNPRHLPEEKQPIVQVTENTKKTTNINNTQPASTGNAAYSNSFKPSNNRELKFIVIDGSNVAREHGKSMGRVFSCRGIKIVVDFFLNRGHKQIVALVPRFRRGNYDHDCPTVNPEILDELEERSYLAYTPSRVVDRRLILPYDDRFILKTALHYDAIIVSNDNYRDLQNENPDWKRIIHKNLLQYSFVGDLFMIADDPMGRRGPNIDEFLSIPTINNNKGAKQMTTNNGNKPVAHMKPVSSVPSSLYANQTNKFVKPPGKQLSGPLRTSAQTIELRSKLLMMCPNKEQQIIELLDLYPYHTDIYQFLSLLSS